MRALRVAADKMSKFILILAQLAISITVFSQKNGSDCIDNSKKAELHNCCSFPTPIPNHVVPGCRAKYQKLSNDHRNHIICIADCHFTEMGVLRNGKIDLKSLRNVTKNELGPNEPEAQDAISRLAEMCVRVTGEQKDAIAKAGTKCSVLAYAFFKCLGDGVFSNCPDKYWSTREICTIYDKGVPLCEDKTN
ncbi:general odorant-binding protein 67-like [Armigeres subalbatus]|uniref:general odorant-binding protein 67-like n=1 Tax=Armigeres subalbatus TaxID=124917 RepID=UPI002ED368BB